MREEKIFDLTLTGELSLDFVNTVDWRWRDDPQELINSYADLLRWARHTKIFDEQEAKNLAEKSARQRAKAEKATRRAVSLRETLFRIFEAIVKGENPAQTDLDEFNSELNATLSQLQIERTAQDFVWSWKKSENEFDRIAWVVARSAAEFLTSERFKNLRVCEAADCGWLFVDTSRTKKRRWCTMESCGNRAKARRFYQQTKARRLQK